MHKHTHFQSCCEQASVYFIKHSISQQPPDRSAAKWVCSERWEFATRPIINLAFMWSDAQTGAQVSLSKTSAIQFSTTLHLSALPHDPQYKKNMLSKLKKQQLSEWWFTALLLNDNLLNKSHKFCHFLKMQNIVVYLVLSFWTFE